MKLLGAYIVTAAVAAVIGLAAILVCGAFVAVLHLI